MIPEFRVLGPVNIRHESCPPMPRTLLALLLLNMNHCVSITRIARELWGEQPPRSWRANVRTYVAALRRVCTAQRVDVQLDLRGSGYVLAIRPDQLDLNQFRALLAAGRAAIAAGHLDTAAERLGLAQALWQGEALEDVPVGSVLAPWRTALEEERLTLAEEYNEVLLRLGRVDEALLDMRLQVAAHPLREGFCGQLMRGLFGAGRTVEALDTFRHHRDALAGEFGIEPSPALQRLQRQILTNDTALARPQAG